MSEGCHSTRRGKIRLQRQLWNNLHHHCDWYRYTTNCVSSVRIHLAANFAYFHSTKTVTKSTVTTTSGTVTISSIIYTTTVTNSDYEVLVTTGTNTIVVRQEASTIPAYASPCTSLARYSSACSCFIGPSTTTTFTVFAPTPVRQSATST